ncbi:hypothetical protein HUU61_21565 [Rhodopseudomonas palustris]|nr:hypothetical protein [Rhodopseudomonas palustris]
MIVKPSDVPIVLAATALQRDQCARIYRAAAALAPAVCAALPVVRAALPAVRAASAVSAIVDRIRNNTYQPRSFHNVD